MEKRESYETQVTKHETRVGSTEYELLCLMNEIYLDHTSQGYSHLQAVEILNGANQMLAELDHYAKLWDQRSWQQRVEKWHNRVVASVCELRDADPSLPPREADKVTPEDLTRFSNRLHALYDVLDEV